MKTHELKIVPQYFQAVKSGEKTFEIRKNDRGFEVGDNLILKEYNLYTERIFESEKPIVKYKGYTGQEITKEISYILEGGQYGLEEGYCILGIKDIDKKTKKYFNLGDTAYMIDDDYRFFESEVYKIELDKGEYYYTTDDCDFETKDIDNWVFTSELFREIHMQNIYESEIK